MSPITILLAEDHRLIPEGLRDLLQIEANIRVIGEAENGRQTVAYGASGYLVKQTDTLLLPSAIRGAHHGSPFICPSKLTSTTCP
ncbi:MAG: hypothetical protein B7Z37_02490 [Verrucomicrobia bacterium 12-59-8]|nr:MAG: hypothetical protein B7Z37_02490 [Verrucomicrobia bacterium 12-59-8]